MNILVLIMGCNVQPGIRNMQAIRDTYINFYNIHKSEFKHNFEFLFYVGNSKKLYQKNDILYCTSNDDISHTFDKTLEAFNYIINNKKFDYLVRVNISTFINIPLLDEAILSFDKNNIYANQFNTYLTNTKYLNDVYPRGDAYIISNHRLRQIINIYSDNIRNKLNGYIDNCDDTLFGYFCMKSYNTDIYVNYYKQLRYNFVPLYSNELTEQDFTMALNCIFSRIKTVPHDATHSGYSWDDNIARKEDVKKFNLLNNYINNNYKILKDISNVYNLNDVMTELQHRDTQILDFSIMSFRIAQFDEIKDLIIKKWTDDEIV